MSAPAISARGIHHRPDQRDPLAQPQCGHLPRQRRRAARIERVRAYDPRPPAPVAQPGQRGDQHVVALARDQRADAQDQRRIAPACRPRPRLGARRRYADPVRRHPEPGDQPPRGRGTGADDRPDLRERRRLRRQQPSTRGFVQPGLVAERMMHQRHQPQPRRLRRQLLSQHPAGQPVDHQRRAPRQRRQRGGGGSPRRRVGKRKAVWQPHDSHVPALRRQPRDQPPVVAVAAGRRVEPTGDREMHPHHPSSASNQARATWLSCSVTRSRFSRPASPSRPARAAAASASKTLRQRNSVVVNRPASSGSSSRLR